MVGAIEDHFKIQIQIGAVFVRIAVIQHYHKASDFAHCPPCDSAQFNRVSDARP